MQDQESCRTQNCERFLDSNKNIATSATRNGALAKAATSQGTFCTKQEEHLTMKKNNQHMSK